MRKIIFSSRGEISTIVVVGMLVLMGVATLLTTTLNRNTQTTQTRANEGDGPGGLCSPNRGGADARGCGGTDGCRDWESCQNGTCLWQNVPYEQQCRGGGGTGGTSQNSVPGCFYLEGDVNKTGDGKFDVTIRFVSQGGDGDITLAKDGVHVAGPNGWNKNVSNFFTYIPTWTGSPITVSNGTKTVTYTGRVANSAACPNAQATLTCTFSRDSGSCGGTTAPAPTNQPASQPTSTPVAQPTNPPASQPTSPPTNQQPTQPAPTATPIPNTTDGRCTYIGDVDCITLTPAPGQCASPEIWCATLNRCTGRTSCPTPTPKPNTVYLPIVQNGGVTPTPNQTFLPLLQNGPPPTPTPYTLYVPIWGSSRITQSGTVTVQSDTVADSCLIRPNEGPQTKECSSYFMTRSDWESLTK